MNFFSNLSEGSYVDFAFGNQFAVTETWLVRTLFGDEPKGFLLQQLKANNILIVCKACEALGQFQQCLKMVFRWASPSFFQTNQNMYRFIIELFLFFFSVFGGQIIIVLLQASMFLFLSWFLGCKKNLQIMSFPWLIKLLFFG